TADGTWDSFLLGCDNKSDWLTFSCKGCSIIFDVPTMKESTLKSMTLSVVYYSCSDNITSEGCQGVIVEKTSVSLLYDEPLDKEMEHCHVVDEEDVVVSGYADNNVSESGGDNEVINHFGEEMVNHMQIT
ncbi:TIR-NBS-LRR RCT1 resistance protein, partial [Trifolium medium]|nr:TIR-NBS-LRR RCT1 resistance protein [Trifolium medium]